MLGSNSTGAMTKTRIVLLSADANFTLSARSAFAADAKYELSVAGDWLRSGRLESEIGSAAVMIIDLNKAEPEELSSLQRVMDNVCKRLPVIVVVPAFDEAAARALVRMRVADILVKPVSPTELVRACLRVVQSASGAEMKESKIFTFLPVAGGVGNTTIAIQSAMTLLTAGLRRNLSTCLVDLNFDHGASTDYLDIESRLDLMEIEPNPERLDRQLLDGMVSHHSSGLAVIAAENRPTEMRPVDENVIMRLLNLVCQCYDHAVIDMPGTWNSWTDNVLLGSNKLFLVTEMSVPGIRRAKKVAVAISTRLGRGPHPQVIVNRYEQHLFAPGMRHKEILKALGDAFAGAVPNNRRLVSEAIDRGVPLDEVRKGNNIAVAIRKLMLPRAAGQAKSSPSLQGQSAPALGWARR
jgi:pilus assembly protein CpaE